MLIAVAVLLIPLIGMQVSDEVQWGVMDFVIIGALVLGAGIAYELITMKMADATKRMLVGIGLIVVVLLIWGQLAVGII